MGEHEHAEKAGAGWHEPVEVAEQFESAKEFEHAAHASEGLHTLRGSSAASHAMSEGGKFSTAMGPIGLFMGINTMLHGESAYERVGGGLDAASSGVGIAEGVAGAAGAESTAAFLHPAGMVVAAGAAGWSAGTHGNKSIREKGWLGKKADGENRNWSDMFGESAFTGGGGASAGPMLAAAGAGAALTTMKDFGETIGAVPHGPVDKDTMEQAAKIIRAQQAQDDRTSQGTYDKLMNVGTAGPAAAAIAGMGNAHWGEQHALDRETDSTYAKALASGMSADGAQYIARLGNPSWKAPHK